MAASLGGETSIPGGGHTKTVPENVRRDRVRQEDRDYQAPSLCSVPDSRNPTAKTRIVVPREKRRSSSLHHGSHSQLGTREVGILCSPGESVLGIPPLRSSSSFFLDRRSGIRCAREHEVVLRRWSLAVIIGTW